jgi:hypothetical protein
MHPADPASFRPDRCDAWRQGATLGNGLETMPGLRYGERHGTTARTREVIMNAKALLVLALLPLASISRAQAPRGAREADRIRPHPENPRFWRYEGRLTLLLGGSKDDNLFQSPDLRQQLDTMQAIGANYIRNTMSDRNDKGFEVYPFRQRPDGKYDLDEWNDEYWRRFENMLRWTAERDIIVQIELWDRFDYADHRPPGNWSRHPYNPKNNVNYTEAESGLKATYRKHPGANEQPFFFTVPALRNNTVLLKYQQAQVATMLSYALKYPNVLYCMDNETSGRPEWGAYWATFIRERARKAGVDVHTTEMWDNWDPKNATHKRTYDHPELYTFLDISQNNHNKGQKHWDNFQWVRRYTAARPRPINTVKIYGADTGRYGTGRDGQERFWRNIFSGGAGTRFHRPASGLGLSPTAKAHIRSMRLLTAELDIFRCTPDAGSTLLGDRSENEAYLTFRAGRQYAVYFPDGGKVTLDLTGATTPFNLKWLDILKSAWGKPQRIRGGGAIPLQAPGRGHWACLISEGT